jgi:hypothetical protein
MYSIGLTQVVSAVQLRVYDDAQLQVHYALQLQVVFAENDNLQASPPYRLHKEDQENNGAYRLQIRLCQPSQEGALGGMCLAKLLHRQLEPGFIPLANSEIVQVH